MFLVELLAMSCAVCFQPLAGDESRPTSLTCGHTFHEVCLEECRKARKVGTIAELECPTCRFTARDVAAKEAAAQVIGTADISSPSAPEVVAADPPGAVSTSAASVDYVPEPEGL